MNRAWCFSSLLAGGLQQLQPSIAAAASFFGEALFGGPEWGTLKGAWLFSMLKSETTEVSGRFLMVCLMYAQRMGEAICLGEDHLIKKKGTESVLDLRFDKIAHWTQECMRLLLSFSVF